MSGDEQGYKACRGEFILAKLREHDAAKLQDVLLDVYRGENLDPGDITKFQWETILSFMGASSEENADVQARMGRQWR